MAAPCTARLNTEISYIVATELVYEFKRISQQTEPFLLQNIPWTLLRVLYETKDERHWLGAQWSPPDRTGVPCESESCTVRIAHSLMIWLPQQCYAGVQIRKNEMGGAGGTYGGQERYIQGVCWGGLWEGGKLEDLRLEGWIVLEWILTFTLLTWRIWWVPTNASKWQMGFNSVFKGFKK